MKPKSEQRLRNALDHPRLSLDALDRFGDGLAADVFARLALERSVEITGEASRAVAESDPELVRQTPDIPWKPAIRLRTRLAHGYTNIEIEFLIETVRREFPALRDQLEQIVEDGK